MTSHFVPHPAPAAGGPRPAYGLLAHIRTDAVPAVTATVATVPGAVVASTSSGADPGVSGVSVDTDGPVTLLRIRALLAERHTADVVHLGDPVLDTAATGKITQRVAVPASSARDL